jgi:hypothetical protein
MQLVSRRLVERIRLTSYRERMVFADPERVCGVVEVRDDRAREAQQQHTDGPWD